MSLIQSEVQELQSIQLEIKRQLSSLKQLRKRKDELEKNILSYINAKGHSGLKYGDVVIGTEEKPYRLYKSSKEKQDHGISLLKDEFGIQDAEKILTRLSDVMKGEEELRCKLKLTKQNQATRKKKSTTKLV